VIIVSARKALHTDFFLPFPGNVSKKGLSHQRGQYRIYSVRGVIAPLNEGFKEGKILREMKGRYIVFAILTVVIALIAVRMAFRQGTSGEVVLEQQFKWFKKLSSTEFPERKDSGQESARNAIISYLGSSISLPTEGVTYYRVRKVRKKRVKTVFIPLRMGKRLYLMGVYRKHRKGSGRVSHFLDDTTLLSGEREGISFVIFEKGDGLKVTIMSSGTLVDLFTIVRNDFMTN